MHISNFDTLEELNRAKLNLNSDLTVEADFLIRNGILNWALKKIIWNSEDRFQFSLKFIKGIGQSYSKNSASLWQVINLLQTEVYQNIVSFEVVDNCIFIKKIPSNIYSINKVSIGIVYSGTRTEATLILDNIMHLRHSNIESEVVICGPEKGRANFDVKKISSSLSLRYIAYDIEPENSRFPISKKKNHLFNSLNYDIRVIAHARIKFGESFISTISGYKFDVITPRVTDTKGNRYLDLVLVGSYDTFRFNPSNIIISNLVEKDYYRLLKNRVPYIDGGLIIINAKVVKEFPFNPKIAWCEGEDLDFARRAYFQGVLLDLLPTTTCQSTSIKFKLPESTFEKAKLYLKKQFLKFGWF